MSYWAQFTVWMLIAFAPLAVNAAACRYANARQGDALFLSGILITFWAIYNFAITTPPGQPENMLALTLLDLTGLGIVLGQWWTERRVYKLVLAGAFLAQLVSHAVFWWFYDLHWLGWATEDREGARYAYQSTLNAWFAVQSVCISWPGGSKIALRIGDFLSQPWSYGDSPHRGEGAR